MTRIYRKWSHDEDAQLLFLREHAKMCFGDIDKVLELRKGASCDRYRVLRPKPYRVTVDAQQRRTENIVEKEAARARQIACQAPPPTSLTASFFGDPPPGRSALDQKRMAAT
ncbi:hypothetical protein [Bradyrhizobium sp. RT9a]|uniref:hypothetical protein n=1 Tax=Bradyrhizobium sp. RT9a TaxID=3156384 RepID=UPI0033945DB2